MEPTYTEVIKLLIQHPENAEPYLLAVDEKGDEYRLRSVGYDEVRLDKIDTTK